ncbi:unnamed protein product [Parnassius mnemosyne]|uniref:Integrase catalytic domain-containing protein n=1 Tax=Parnassius mnemosyne TaxID=213953 RepID=A0AAV1M6C2_9NEOP
MSRTGVANVTCAAVKGPQTRNRGALKLYNVGGPWERIAIDVAGPFPESESGHTYFMVVIDYFTKWPEVSAIFQEASTVADKLVHEVFCRFGVPLEIHSDQGRNFDSQIFQETCQVMGTHKTRTTYYHPQSNGMVERFNQTEVPSKSCGKPATKLGQAHTTDFVVISKLYLRKYISDTGCLQT